MALKVRIHESVTVTKQNFISDVMALARRCLQYPNGGSNIISATVSDGTKSEVELDGFDLQGDDFASVEDIDQWRLPTREERELWVQHKDPFGEKPICDNSK